jgi:hypothetical protein
MLQLSSTQTQKPSELNFTIVGSLHEKSHADLFIYYVLLVHFALPIIQSLSLPPKYCGNVKYSIGIDMSQSEDIGG